MRRFAAAWALTATLALSSGCLAAQGSVAPQAAPASSAPTASAGLGNLPRREDSVKFLVMGDSGSGTRRQYELAQQMVEAWAQFPFEFAVMLGDNIYGPETPREYERKFERPYKPLLDAGVQFYAAIGNHDTPNQRFYKLFNMDGQRYYTFSKGPVQFFALDSTYMDPGQLKWLDRELGGSRARWKLLFMHHPLYSSGARHGSELDLRAMLEPILVRHGVDGVFAGHEHFYERINPQQGIYYFTSGSAGKLRRGNIRRGALTAAGFDTDLSFMVIEITANELHFRTISRTGSIVDSGMIERPDDPTRMTGQP